MSALSSPSSPAPAASMEDDEIAASLEDDEIAASMEDDEIAASLEDDEIAASLEDDEISPPSPTSSSLESYGSFWDDDADRGEVKRPRVRPPSRRTSRRTWPSADEVALLEAVVAHKEQHECLPAPADLVAALSDRLDVGAEQVAMRMEALRIRFIYATRRLSRGVVPESDDDLRILKLSRRIWKVGERKGPRARAPPHERRGFPELAGLYPFLASKVEAIDAEQRTAGVLRTAFGLIGDERATELEAKAKKQRVKEWKAGLKLSEAKSAVAAALLRAVE